jgi:hypothetical protein
MYFSSRFKSFWEVGDPNRCADLAAVPYGTGDTRLSSEEILSDQR